MLKKWGFFIGIAVFFFVSLLACLSIIYYAAYENKFTKELYSIPLQTSASPSKINIIELKTMSYDKKNIKNNNTHPEFYSFRIYYGEYGSHLEKYKEYTKFVFSSIDHFDIQWINDNLVTINVIRKREDGTTFKEESIKLKLSDN